MRVVALIQTRLNSTRYPRKAFADLEGRPLIQHVLDRVNQIRGVHRVALLVPEADAPEFRASVCGLSICAPTGVGESDVLARYAAGASLAGANVVMRITGDCPLIDPDIAAQVLALYHDTDVDFASNDTRVSGFPDGFDVEVFSRQTLALAHRSAAEPEDREHVTPWMRRHARCAILYAPARWTGPKLSIDTPDDLDTVRHWVSEQRRQTA